MVDWPPHYADPIVFRLRFVPHPRPQPVVPAHLTSREGTFHAPTEAEAVETLQRVGALPSTLADGADPRTIEGRTDRNSAVELAASTRNPDYAARILGLPRKRLGDMLHALKEEHSLGPADNVTFHENGDVEFEGIIIGNIFDYGH